MTTTCTRCERTMTMLDACAIQGWDGKFCPDCFRSIQTSNPTQRPEHEPILDEAFRLISGQRRADYGDAQTSFDRIAGMWSAYLGHDLTGLDVVNLMCLLKVARAKNGFHRDSYVDICGYAALSEQLEVRR